MIMKYKRPDKKNALSIADAAKRDIDFTLSLKITEDSSSTIIRNIYECFRMLGDALLVGKGIKSENQSMHHVICVKELLKLQVSTSRPINLIENLRQLRHNINYYGYMPKLVETEDVVSLAKSCFNPLLKEVVREINK